MWAYSSPVSGECRGSRLEGSWEGHRSGFPSWEDRLDEVWGLANLTSVPPLPAGKPPRPSPRRQTWVDFSSWPVLGWWSQWFLSRQTKGRVLHASPQSSWIPCSYLGYVKVNYGHQWISNFTKYSSHGNHWMFRDPVSHPEVGVELSWSGDDFTHVVCLLVQVRPAQEARLTTSPPVPPWCLPCFSSNREQPWTTPSRFIWDNQSSGSSVTVKTTLGQRISTFMQRSKPSAGETPALLTRTSMFFWKNFSAAAQTFSHWALSVTSCSSNVQESSPNLWGEEGMFNYWTLHNYKMLPAVVPGRPLFLPACFYQWGQLCPRSPELACWTPSQTRQQPQWSGSFRSFLPDKRSLGDGLTDLLLSGVYLVLPGLYELYKQQLITRVTVHSYLVLVTNNSGLGWASKTSSSLQWTRSNDINTELLVSTFNIFAGNNGQVLTPLIYQYCLFYIYLGLVWCIYSRYTVAEQ